MGEGVRRTGEGSALMPHFARGKDPIKNLFFVGSIGEFFRSTYVEPVVKISEKKSPLRAKAPLEDLQIGAKGISSQFTFGPRRYVSSGPRRLFVPQKGLMSPVFEDGVGRPRGLLRVVSSCS